MEAPHVEVLNYIEAHTLPPVELYANSDEPRGWTTDQLAKARPKLARMVDGLIPVLSGHGLLKDMGGQIIPGGVGPDQWAITDLGRHCLDLLKDHPDRAAPETDHGD